MAHGGERLVWVLAAFAGSAGCGGEDCDLDRETRDLVGFGLVDCGIAAAGDTASVDRCAVDAHEAGSPFRALYETNDGLEAIVGSDDGTYYLLRSTGDGKPITRARCASGVVEGMGDGERVACDAPGDFETICE